MSYPKYNNLCMIYNRYNPCHVVYVGLAANGSRASEAVSAVAPERIERSAPLRYIRTVYHIYIPGIS